MSCTATSQPLRSGWKPNHTTLLVWPCETNRPTLDSGASEVSKWQDGSRKDRHHNISGLEDGLSQTLVLKPSFKPSYMITKLWGTSSAVSWCAVSKVLCGLPTEISMVFPIVFQVGANI